MAYRYVPPALRAQGKGGDSAKGPDYRNSSTSMPAYSVSSGLRGGDGNNRPQRRRSNVTPDEEVYSLKDIDRHFWPEDDLKAMTAETSKTLHDSAATPGALAYLLLFKDANPRWESDGIIFTKSSLDLLPVQLADPTHNLPAQTPTTNVGDAAIAPANSPVAAMKEPQEHLEGEVNTESSIPESSAKVQPEESKPVAIFTQLRRPPYNPDSSVFRSFKFLGYYRVTRLQFLDPNTPELERMLEQKWTFMDPRTGKPRHREREGQSWDKSLSLRWAVVKFGKDEQADQERGKPDIKRLADDAEDGGGRENKSVNELLRELRVKNGDAVAETAKKSNENVKQDDMGGEQTG